MSKIIRLPPRPAPQPRRNPILVATFAIFAQQAREIASEGRR